jgi:hypothetical protein
MPDLVVAPSDYLAAAAAEIGGVIRVNVGPDRQIDAYAIPPRRSEEGYAHPLLFARGDCLQDVAEALVSRYLTAVDAGIGSDLLGGFLHSEHVRPVHWRGAWKLIALYQAPGGRASLSYLLADAEGNLYNWTTANLLTLGEWVAVKATVLGHSVDDSGAHPVRVTVLSNGSVLDIPGRPSATGG